MRAYEPKNIQKKHHEQHEKFEINTLLKYDIYIYTYIYDIYIYSHISRWNGICSSPTWKKKECYFSHQSINRHETSLHPSCHLSWLVGLKRCSLRSSFFTLKIEPRAAGKKVPWRVPLRCLEPRFFFFNAETRNPGKQPMKVHLPEMLIFLGHFVKIPPMYLWIPNCCDVQWVRWTAFFGRSLKTTQQPPSSTHIALFYLFSLSHSAVFVIFRAHSIGKLYLLHWED